MLWTLALLSVLAVSFARTTRSETKEARNLFENARARAFADAGVSLAIVGLLDPNPATRWPGDGRPRTIVYDGGRLAVRLEDEGGKIDLNVAPREMIESLLASLGVDRASTVSIVEAIGRRREGSRGESNPPFLSIDDARSLPGMSHRIYDRIEPYITVFSGNPRIDILTASRDVLLGLPNVNRDEVAAIVAARSARGNRSSGVAPTLTGEARYAELGNTRVASVVSIGTTETGATFARRAVISLSGRPEHPYDVLEWRQYVEDAVTAWKQPAR